MNTAFSICAAVGGVIFLIQLVMQLMGLDHDADVDVDADGDHGDSSLFFGILSIRTVVAAVMFFGIGGLAALQNGQPEFTALTIAGGCGLVAMILVGLVLKGMKKLQASGSTDIRQAMGQAGVVYLAIPESKSGAGKVTVTVNGRSTEFAAMTTGAALATGEQIVVTNVLTEDTLEVAAAPSQEA
ncbi:MAG: hypothetical protein AB7K09_19185 [Planctomycetota bacterium]